MTGTPMAAVWQYLLQQIHTNQFFTGAALGGVALAVLNYLRHGAQRLLQALVRRCTVSASIHSEDDLYVPLADWLSKHRFDLFAQRYRVRTPCNDGPLRQPEFGAKVPETDAAIFGPDYGSYVFRYRRRWILVTVHREGEAGAQNTSQRAQTREFLTISYLGFSRSLLDDIINNAALIARERSMVALPCLQGTIYGWEPAGEISRAGPQVCPVVLNGELLEDIEADLGQFFDKREWYEARGIPWRRGYLLHGPPGTGKTSLCRYLARRYGMRIYIVDSAAYKTDRLGAMLKQVAPRSLVLFEDIDCYDFENRRTDDSKPASGNDELANLLKNNIGTLLNAIDGINPPEGMLIVMTSNNPESLDPALVRPGRIDRKVYLGHCTPSHAAKLLRKFFPDAANDDVVAFRAAVPAGKFTPAELQEIFIASGSVEAAIGALWEPKLEVQHG